MPASYIGSRTIGGCFPTTVDAVAAINAAAALGRPELDAKVLGFTNVQAAITVGSPSLAGTITAAAQVGAQLQAAVSGPVVTLQGAAILTLIAEINALLGMLEAQIAVGAAFSASFGASGVHLYSYFGPASDMGASLAGVLGSALPGGQTTDTVGAVLLATSVPATRIALGTFVGVSIS